MCFHYSMSAKAAELAKRYGRKTDAVEMLRDVTEEQYHINAFINPECDIVTLDDEIQTAFWGLIPFWTKTQDDAKKIRTMTYNARSETVFQLSSFREPIMKKRCLIPSTGYIEYHHNEDKSTQPYFIYLADDEIFSMAGVYDIWYNPQNGEFIKTFSLITTQANVLTAQIHNGGKNPRRMPVILSKENEEKWMDSKLKKEHIELLLKPFDAEQMNAYKINKDFIKKNPKDESIIEIID